MKHFLFSILLLLSYALSAGNINDEVAEVNKDKKPILQYGISSISHYRIYSSGKKKLEYKTEYDKKGNKVKYTEFNYAGDTLITTYFYNDQDRLVLSKTHRIKDGKISLHVRNSYKYNSDGQIKEYIFNYTDNDDGMRTECKYDNKNRLIEEYHWYAEGFEGYHKHVHAYEENAQGQIIKYQYKRINIYAELKPDGSYGDLTESEPKLILEIVYEQPSGDHLLPSKKIHYGENLMEYGMEYDPKGNMIKESLMYKGKLKVRVFEYDELGRLVKEYAENKSKNARIYKYYKDTTLLAESGYKAMTGEGEYEVFEEFEIGK
ncbi:MAG: hypothetical protein AB1458_08270 [Bacteroidota bacterium]